MRQGAIDRFWHRHRRTDPGLEALASARSKSRLSEQVTAAPMFPSVQRRLEAAFGHEQAPAEAGLQQFS